MKIAYQQNFGHKSCQDFRDMKTCLFIIVSPIKTFVYQLSPLPIIYSWLRLVNIYLNLFHATLLLRKRILQESIKMWVLIVLYGMWKIKTLPSIVGVCMLQPPLSIYHYFM